MSDSLRPHELRHTRLPCPLLSPSLFKLMSVELVCFKTVPFILLLLEAEVTVPKGEGGGGIKQEFGIMLIDTFKTEKQREKDQKFK